MKNGALWIIVRGCDWRESVWQFPNWSSRVTAVRTGPVLLDRLDLLLLQLAKRRRGRYSNDVAFYESFFAEYDLRKYIHDVRNAWRFGVIARVMEEEFFPKAATILDVGCGLGTVRMFLCEKHSYIGCDVSEATLVRARKIHSSRNAYFDLGSLPSLPIEAGAVDAALCLEVLEHIPDDDSAVAELARVVRPGGILIASVPNSYYWPEYESLIGHIRHYDWASLTALVEKHGFLITRRIPQHRGFWRGYHYFYLPMRVLEALVTTVWREFSVYETRLYRAVAQRILARLQASESIDEAPSTFIVCRRQPKVGS